MSTHCGTKERTYAGGFPSAPCPHRSLIARWLGHESLETTQMYLHADLRIKEVALEKVMAFDVRPGRFRPDDELFAFLESL
jgi:integrase/recombinase XerD